MARAAAANSLGVCAAAKGLGRVARDNRRLSNVPSVPLPPLRSSVPER